ncbi:hypothetical protein AJ85_16635 [Alkalihalobacillus alcalophilus ATCC 27647 = CGMCC 1.3604]|uniref:Oxidoreductase n=1 Tax=Alkalihalobacillus alcalophilus ATCC 27647 = CGMCC 1.3604 TaxID=1218173 RepID=A0A094XEX6_ALKAL|nr:Gfo/Idh/MocA family oxidoreductase [Alkalihalobacillus alcalophilus]KGA97305.1 hypothetical protein BALCAV_0210870 [Alkalihalobacillus alcalophilus ATCC 27647 = CGMCC 1.3604]MED1562518.1 Gfo/Idh/MocA family oxidoreductase [Alkalihalobacillus alcalophilus]THG92143.1 hypothetical protein AJ85_16635 [Alkalihalobacillus alcalophilus ATCC 27647 = CGMCC 1.3604]
MKLGIIGCGRITEKHCQTIDQLKELTVVALSDLSSERMNLIRSHLKNTSNLILMHKKYEEMLSNQNIDLVLIATSSGFHAEIAEKALKAGKHVLVEKPLTLSLKETSDLTELAKKRGCYLFVCYQLRFLTSMLKIKEVLKQGLLGEIIYGVGTIEINRSKDYYEQAAWRGTWKHDGGMLINQGIHMVDLLTWFMGDLESVQGEIKRVHEYKETEDVAIGILKFKNGSTGVIEANSIALPNNRGYSLKLFAEKGTVVIRGQKLDEVERFIINGHEEVPIEGLDHDGLEQVRMYKACLDCIAGRKSEFVADGEESIRALETIFALYRSALNQEVVQLPLEDFQTGEMSAWEGSK